MNNYLNPTLGNLSGSEFFNDPIEICEENITLDPLEALKMMLLIRSCEIKIAEGRKERLIGGPVHLGVGQEAVATGISSQLKRSDSVFGAHRSHSHLLALGSDPRKLFSEILGRYNGHCKGMGGSMHLIDTSVGFLGSVPIVAGTVPLAVGAAMAARLKGSDSIAVSYLGDGACEEGVVHESLNLASINKEPVLFVVENNLFSSHMHISLRQPESSTARFAKSNSIPFHIVDGNDVVAVSKCASDLISRSRRGDGPGFIEAVTYRWYGHVDWREDVDVGVNRSQDDIENWKRRDPISRLKNGLIEAKMLDHNLFEDLKTSTIDYVQKCWSQALSDPYPKPESLLAKVYSDSSPRG